MSRYHYRAFCGNCNTTVRRDTCNTFMSAFFLGKRCTTCGERKSDRLFADTSWKVEFGNWERQKKFNLLKPKTWCSKYDWVEFKEES